MENLHELHDELMTEKEQLEERLSEIEDELLTVIRTLEIMDQRKRNRDAKQTSFLKDEKKAEYANMTFKDAVLDLFAKYPLRVWRPKDVTKSLLDKGFVTKARKFGNITRTMLHNLREEGIINAEKVRVGNQEVWQYKYKTPEEKEKTRVIRIRRRTPINIDEE